MFSHRRNVSAQTPLECVATAAADPTSLRGPFARRAWVALAILLFLGLTLAVAETLRIERTGAPLAAENGQVLLTEAGQGLLAGYRCRLVIGQYGVPFYWPC
jgi:hypothetical protein